MTSQHMRGCTGLGNIGNTCYLNSCIQALSHTYELDLLLNTPNVRRYIKSSSSGTVLREWNDLRTLMWSKNGTVVPNRFVATIQRHSQQQKNGDFSGFAQNDVSEFIVFLVDIFDNALSRRVTMNINGTTKNDTDRTAVVCYEMMRRMYETKYSEITKLFNGIQVTQIIGIDSPNKNITLSAAPEPYFIINLSLPIGPDPMVRCRKCSIYDCFDYYTQDEVLDGDNRWQNDTTGKLESVVKRTRFWSFPDIMVVSIGRTDVYGRKNNAIVSVPENMVLDMGKYTCGYNRSNNLYELYAVCNHMGGPRGGHYTANVMVGNNRWFEFNDTRVSEINHRSVVTSAAYTMFWRRSRKK